MKFRLGFVSNSSSCSFVIHRSVLTDEQVKELKKFYKENEWDEIKRKGIYDDGGTYFNITKKYIKFNDNSSTMLDKLSEMGIKDEDIYKEYS